MGRRSLILAWFVATAAAAGAQTQAQFTLGLGGEYLGEDRTIDGTTTSNSTVEGLLSLNAQGSILDPRFLHFDLGLETIIARLSQTDQDDAERRQLGYHAAVDAFSNRMFSLGVNAGRQTSDASGYTRGMAVGGTAQHLGGRLSFRHRRWPELTLIHTASSFEADDPDSLRDEERAVSTLRGRYAAGAADLALHLEREDTDLYNNRANRLLDWGRLFLDLGRGRPMSFYSHVQANRYAYENRVASTLTETEVTVIQNQLRHTTASRGFWTLNADAQRSQSGDETTDTGHLWGSLVQPVSQVTDLVAEAGYLRTDISAEDTLDQGRASLGIRWGAQAGSWEFSAYPLASYITTRPSSGVNESALGGRIAVSARRVWPTGVFHSEAEYFSNQLSIAPPGAGDGVGGGSFLAGLEKERRRLNLLGERRFGRFSRIAGQVEYRYRVRLYLSEEVSEDIGRAQLELGWRVLSVVLSATRFEITGGEIPSTTTTSRADLRWAVTPWFLVDLLYQTEDRTVLDSEDSLDYWEAGCRFSYARLAFYARLREQDSVDVYGSTRQDRRVWAGIRRTFDFGVGFGNGR